MIINEMPAPDMNTLILALGGVALTLIGLIKWKLAKKKLAKKTSQA